MPSGVHLDFSLIDLKSQTHHFTHLWSLEIEGLMKSEKDTPSFYTVYCEEQANQSTQISTRLPSALRPFKAYILGSHHLICFLTWDKECGEVSTAPSQSKHLINVNNFKSSVRLALFVPNFLFFLLDHLPGSLISESQ